MMVYLPWCPHCQSHGYVEESGGATEDRNYLCTRPATFDESSWDRREYWETSGRICGMQWDRATQFAQWEDEAEERIAAARQRGICL